MSLDLGSVLADRYRIDALLGEGGMGAVHRALDTRLNLTVAVKEHFEDPTGRLSRSTDPAVRAQLEKARERFQAEAQVLARLRHPGLPGVRDHFVIAGEGQYLVMEFIEGQDLQVLSKQAGPLREERVVAIGLELCDVLEYLHIQNPPVIHRDIKPANLRVTPEGQVVLVDFGICKVGLDQLTRTAARAVSEGFSPPEMYGQRGQTDARSDIYSLGATLLALVSGEVPPSPTDRVTGSQLPRLPERVSGITSPLQEILEKALELRPDNRYQSASELKTDLEGSLGQVSARAPIADDVPSDTFGVRTSAGSDTMPGKETRLVDEEPSLETGAPSPEGKKSKAVAVLLAIFFGPLSWLYTYRRNTLKFIIGCTAFALLLVIYPVILDVPGYGMYSDAVSLAAATFLVMNLAIWLWAIIDNSLRSQRFFAQYRADVTAVPEKRRWVLSAWLLSGVLVATVVAGGIVGNDLERQRLAREYQREQQRLETGTVTDTDGNTYRTVKIGDQWWMAENLRVTHYRNGDPIRHVTDADSWSKLGSGAYCSYNNNESYAATYGLLYNWYAVADPRNIAPAGWRVPTDEDWKQLEMYLGMSQAEADDYDYRGTDEGGKLKEVGTAHWDAPNTGATNESGFSALPGGYRFSSGYFSYMGYIAFFWSSTESSSYDAWYRYLYYNYSQVLRYSSSKRNGVSVRCVRD